MEQAKWGKPGLLAQPSHSICLEYLWQISNIFWCNRVLIVELGHLSGLDYLSAKDSNLSKELMPKCLFALSSNLRFITKCNLSTKSGHCLAQFTSNLCEYLLHKCALSYEDYLSNWGL